MHFFFQKFTDDEKREWKTKAVEFRKTTEYAKLKQQHKLRRQRKKKSLSIVKILKNLYRSTVTMNFGKLVVQMTINVHSKFY